MSYPGMPTLMSKYAGGDGATIGYEDDALGFMNWLSQTVGGNNLPIVTKDPMKLSQYYDMYTKMRKQSSTPSFSF